MAIFYVDLNAAGRNDGSSFLNAFTDLQSALAIAGNGDQIFVAAGTYTPTDSTDRDISFVIPNGVEVYGGFSGNETQLNQRNIEQNITILSGNIGSNAADDNSHHVVDISNTSASTVLNGFTIADGRADQANNAGTNREDGAGIFGNNTNARLSNLVITNNTALDDGGGLFLGGSSNAGVNAIIFLDNTASDNGGAIYISGNNNSVAISNNLFVGNQSTGGGAIHTDEIDILNVVNNTFFDNQGGVADAIFDETFVTNENRSIGNNIFADSAVNPNQQVFFSDTTSTGTITINNNLIQGTSILPGVGDVIGGGNLINIDPLFIDPANNDFRLQSASPGVDAGDSSFIGTPNDLAENPRISGSAVDIGALESDSSGGFQIIGNTPGAVTNISIAENTSVVTDVNSSADGSGNVTYTILTAAEGSFAEDSEVFTIDPNTGLLSFINPPDFENPLDQGGDNVYQVDIVATSGTQSVVQLIDVTVTDVADDFPQPLEIIGNTPGEVLNISISENTSFVTDVNSTTESIGNVTYSILSVADGSFAEDLNVFTIDPNSGVLSFINPPDFENPLDQGGDNVYQVDVLATSGTQSAVQFIDVTVTNDPADDLAILGNTPGQVTNISVSENNSLVVDVEVNVTGNLTYRILGVQDQSFAEDADLFTIDPNTGLLSFINPPDFENPLDQGGDNVYQVDIEVAFAGNTATQLIDVTVLDVAENRLLTSALRFNSVAVDFAAETTYLVTDNNNNLLVDDLSELFGGAVGEGFADLASFDSNNDGLVNALDLNFADLLVWQDANDDGITDPTELISLAQTGIASVPTDFTDTFNSPALQTNILDGLVTEDALTESI